MWVKATKDEAQAARNAGKPVKFTSEGWMVEGGDARGRPPGPDERATTASDLTSEAEAVFRPLTYEGGQYVTNYTACECGEQYLEKGSHVRTSARHKQWERGEVEVHVPPQPLMGAYPRGMATPRLEMGVNKLCERCKAKNKKGEDYYPDPNSRPDNRYPCRLCNGHGIRPNVG